MPTTYFGARVPTRATLERYGLTLAEWKAIARRQRGRCGICRGRPASGVLHVDHEHVPGWIAMPPLERARYCRGLLCFRCNRYVLGQLSVDALRAALAYLTAYDERTAP